MKEIFDKQKDNTFYSYTIENQYLKVKVIDYGATLVSLYVKQLKKDVVLGFDDIDGYQNRVEYMGATIGRVCNRIGKGKYKIGNKEYQLAKNNNGNCLHGGNEGFNNKVFNVVSNQDSIILSYLSKDGEENFNGNVNVTITYTINNNCLDYTYEVCSDQDSIVSICNHAFFNLDGYDSESILNHKMWINSDEIAMVDEDGLTLPTTMKVESTPFNFKEEKLIGECIDVQHDQIIKGNGYDHNYILNNSGYDKVCYLKNNECKMTVLSDLNNMHVYSANYLSGNHLGKNKCSMPKRSSICFETQHYPNAINYEGYIKPIIKKGEVVKHITTFKFEMENENEI